MNKRQWLVMLDDGRFAWRTTAAFIVQWVVREQNKRPSLARVNHNGHEVAQVTSGGFWHVNENVDGGTTLRMVVDHYMDSH